MGVFLRGAPGPRAAGAALGSALEAAQARPGFLVAKEKEREIIFLLFICLIFYNAHLLVWSFFFFF